MTKNAPKSEAKVGLSRKAFKVEAPKLPEEFRGAQYGNFITVSATAQEIFLDLFQGGPEAGGHGEARIVFVGRFIFPLTIAKAVIGRLQGLVESIEEDTGIKLPVEMNL